MSVQKRAAVNVSSSEGASTSSSEDYIPSKKRAMATRTIEKWIQENDKVLNTKTWLTYEKVDHESIASMKCSACIRYKNKLVSCRNFNPGFIDGSRNLRAGPCQI